MAHSPTPPLEVSPAPLCLRRIVSGGQTGADRAALDWAIARGVPHSGYCPKGRLSEDGVIPDRYALTELGSMSYLARTEKNVRESDGTVIFTLSEKLAGGPKRTAEFAEAHGKPCLHIWHTPRLEIAALALRAFVVDHRIQVLNV